MSKMAARRQAFTAEELVKYFCQNESSSEDDIEAEEIFSEYVGVTLSTSEDSGDSQDESDTELSLAAANSSFCGNTATQFTADIQEEVKRDKDDLVLLSPDVPIVDPAATVL